MLARVRLLLLAAASLALAAACKTQRAYVGWSASTIDLERVDARASGPLVGWEGSAGAALPGGFAELRLQQDGREELDVFELLAGMRTKAVSKGAFSVRLQADLGFAAANLERLQNGNPLISLGVGLRPELALAEGVSLVGLLGYRAYFDVTPPTTCNDGTTSTSTGSGTCSHHGGIDHYNDPIGDGGGPEIALGISFSL